MKTALLRSIKRLKAPGKGLLSFALVLLVTSAKGQGFEWTDQAWPAFYPSIPPATNGNVNYGWTWAAYTSGQACSEDSTWTIICALTVQSASVGSVVVVNNGTGQEYYHFYGNDNCGAGPVTAYTCTQSVDINGNYSPNTGSGSCDYTNGALYNYVLSYAEELPYECWTTNDDSANIGVSVVYGAGYQVTITNVISPPLCYFFYGGTCNSCNPGSFYSAVSGWSSYLGVGVIVTNGYDSPSSNTIGGIIAPYQFPAGASATTNSDSGGNGSGSLTWQPMTNSSQAYGILGTNSVLTLAFNNTNLYAGGNFLYAGGTNANRAASWSTNGETWSVLGPSGATNGFQSGVYAAIPYNSNGALFGGTFNKVNYCPTNLLGLSADNFGIWQGGTVNTNSAPLGPEQDVYAAAATSNNHYYLAGNFEFLASGSTVYSNICYNDNGAYTQLTADALNATAYAIATNTSGDLFVGGAFTSAGGSTANFIAEWKPGPTTWSSLGSGSANGVGSNVLAVAVDSSGNVYAGGQFTKAGGNTANYIAYWNGTSWSGLVDATTSVNGVNGNVRAIAVDPVTGDVYVGGDFTTAGGYNANYVAMWNGTNWTPLGDGVSATVRALAIDPTFVYLGGDFTAASGVFANKVVRWMK